MKTLITLMFLLGMFSVQAKESLNCRMNVSLKTAEGYEAGNVTARQILKMKGYDLFENESDAPFSFSFGLLGAGEINGHWRFQWSSALSTNKGENFYFDTTSIFELPTTVIREKIAHAMQVPSCKKMYRKGLVN